MVERFVLWFAFCVLVLALCWAKPNAGRIFVGIFFLVMAIGVNIVLSVVDAQSFVGLGKTSFIPVYRWVFVHIVALNPPLAGLVAASFEITIALLMLSKGRFVTVGLVGGILFLLVITPLGAETLANPVMAVALVLLLRTEFSRSLLDMLRAGLGGHKMPVPAQRG